MSGPTGNGNSRAFGLDSESYSNHATFFDYDRDGDLDVYLINHPTDFSRANEVRQNPHQPEEFATDLFFRNDGGHFTDVSVNTPDLPDIYLVGTQRPNRLYRNLGDFTFEAGDGIARVYGLRSAMAGEMVEFDGGVRGLVLKQWR